ncbi:MAG: hypothetical protein F6K28_46765 [Microcoleus sp. SIO2G3]|nr:hypothetical protein [Microcoleus sp. SIO2G3]
MIQTKQIEGFYIGSTEPEKVTGTMWIETDNGGALMTSWAWLWDGSAWVSPEQDWSVSFSAQAAASTHYLTLYRRIRLNSHRIEMLPTVNQSSSNNWNFALSSVNNNNGKTARGSRNSNSASAFQWLSSVGALSSVLAPNDAQTSRRLELVATPTGSPGSLSGVYTLLYQFQR